MTSNHLIIKELKSSIKEIFELQESDRFVANDLSKELIEKHVEYLRANLNASAKKCSVYAFLMKHFENEINRVTISNSQNSRDDYAIEKWSLVINIHKSIYDMIGYLTLLQMDATTTCISLFQATNDTERIMFCKHAYTIIYEALEHNLFKRVSRAMRQYPVELILHEELDKLWKDIKRDIKKIVELEEAKQVRNNIDAHKADSFIEQINVYKKCRWTQSIINLYYLILAIENIQNCVDNINKNMNKLYDEYKIMLMERIKKFDDILKELQQPDETFIKSK